MFELLADVGDICEKLLGPPKVVLKYWCCGWFVKILLRPFFPCFTFGLWTGRKYYILYFKKASMANWLISRMHLLTAC